MDNQAPGTGSAPAENGTPQERASHVVPPRPVMSAADAAARHAAPPTLSQPWATGRTDEHPTTPLTGTTTELPPYIAPEDRAPGEGTTDRPAERKGRGRLLVGALVAAAVVGGASGLGGSYAGSQLWAPAAGGGAESPSSITVNNPGSVNEATAIAAEALPSTVTISVTTGDAGGSGTGVVLSEDGYVVTNTHVVTLGGASADGAIRVTDANGRIYDAEIVGTDPVYDLAVIKLEGAEGMTPIEFADSSELNVGDTTVAIGAPLGLPNTVTTGIVSALNRSIQIASAAAPDSADQEQDSDQGSGEDSPFFFDIPGQEENQGSANETISIAVIQTDAAINPGNSGGALVNSEGQLIGINVAIATASGSTSEESGSVGIGFSIPSNVVQRVTDEIIENGAASHGLLGASVTSAAAYEDAEIEGAMIAEVVQGGAAAEAGLREGDIVTEFNGVPITSSTDLTAQVRAAAGGSDATLTYVRDGEAHTVDVTLGTLE
ncbi:S1C family serine protease [Microbacterium sp. Marseille-Q6965]|uniref:S1C family serine protease n=1 Tax=Microbacterium sp. Marseille-Q6965 TaxID=2965072 RepID=UPI0021B82328|nr:trypsin-like peptidase domain-containing protein [Microbacterium sp. Marseille-Q6965]